MMKGMVCEQPGKLKLAEMPEPEPPPGHALVGIRRIGICGTDLHAYQGNQPFFTYPRVLGHELAGIVEEAGENAEGIRPGDQVSVIPYMHCGVCVACRNGKTNCCTDMKVLGVHIDGGMRERISVPVTHLVRTDGLTLDQTAVLEPLAIGAHAVRRSGLHSGETVLVIGAGPIGLGVMAFAKRRGARVIAMDVHEKRLTHCRVWTDIDLSVIGGDAAMNTVADWNKGELPTVVFDATGSARSMTDAFGFVAHGGKLVYVGLVKSDITFHDPEFHKREMTLMGSRNATPEDFREAMELLRKGSVDVNRYITHRVRFEKLAGKFDEWLKPASNVIKAMVDI